MECQKCAKWAFPKKFTSCQTDIFEAKILIPNKKFLIYCMSYQKEERMLYFSISEKTAIKHLTRFIDISYQTFPTILYHVMIGTQSVSQNYLIPHLKSFQVMLILYKIRNFGQAKPSTRTEVQIISCWVQDYPQGLGAIRLGLARYKGFELNLYQAPHRVRTQLYSNFRFVEWTQDCLWDR